MVDYCEVRRWAGMMERCYSPENASYKNYGGRGIKVCERWHNYANFFEDIGKVPKGLSIDRINNDGDYEPSNVRLADRTTQVRNRRTTLMVTRNGITKPLAQWSEETGVDYQAMFYRYQNGLDIIDTPERDNNFVTKVSKITGIAPNTIKYRHAKGITLDRTTDLNRHLTVNGETRSVKEWSTSTGVKHKTILNRLAAGKSPEEAIQPVNYPPRLVTYNGETHNLCEWARILGVSRYRLGQRLDIGMTVEEAFSPASRRGKRRPKQPA